MNTKRIMFYFCGYDDYFYHYHMLNQVDEKTYTDIIVIDIPGFGYNKSYIKDAYNEISSYNYFDNTDEMCKKINDVLIYITNSDIYKIKNYEQHIILGHSTGGHIALSYVSRYYNEDNKENHPFVIERICLNSPLTQIYFVSNIITKLIYYLSLIIGYFSKQYDLRKLLVGTTQNNDYNIKLLNKCLYLINPDGSNIIDYIYKSNIGQPLLVGFINAVNKETHRLIYNKNKINIKTIVICSNKYGIDATNYHMDDSTHPDYTINDIKKIIEPKYLTLCQTNTGHDVLIKPYIETHNDLYWYDFIKLFLS